MGVWRGRTSTRGLLNAAFTRRTGGLALAVVGLLIMLIIPAAVWNPWRLIVLDRLVRPLPFVVIAVLAGTLIVAAGFVGLRGRGSRVVAGSVVPLVVAGALFPGLPAVVADRTIGLGGGDDLGVVAVSPDGRYEVVARMEVLSVDNLLTHFVVRTRAGWLSRQGDAPIANCTRLGYVEPGAVTFTGATSVSIAVDDQSIVVVHFDPHALVAAVQPDC